MRVIKIFGGTIVDGIGLRTSIYFAGCKHYCKGCHNPESWDFKAGEFMTVKDILEKVKYYNFNVTLSGGDPLYQDLEVLSFLCKKIHDLNLNIWLYTGFVFEELQNDVKYKKILENIDVIVDGPFIEKKKNDKILFRGSSNQRILQKTNNNKWLNINYDDIIN
jgi:anaerobic ribonucleoside-triphosphate reductase activating protein